MQILSLSKLRYFISSILILVFFLHGILYYFNPDDLLDNNSPLKLIKYITVLSFLIINVDKINFARIFIFIFWATVFLCFLLVSNPFLNENISVVASKYLPYLFPATLYLVAPILNKFNLKFFSITILIITLVAGYIEFYLLEGIFTRFDLKNDGLRISTIFINPNNAGFVIGLLHYFLLKIFNYKKLSAYIFSAIITINCLIVIIFTGSKTGLIILILNVLMFTWKYLKKYLETKKISRSSLQFFCFLLVLGFLASTSKILFNTNNSSETNQGVTKTRDMNAETGGTRLKQIIDFKQDLGESFLFPYAHKKHWTIDNTYLQFWGDFSFIGFLFLVFLIAWSFYRIFKFRREYIYPFFLILICGFSLNYLYLWPPAYVFWWYVFSKSDKIKQ